MTNPRFRSGPAMVVAAIALIFALAGTAIAGPDVVSKALTKSKVKQIARKQANKVFDARKGELQGPKGEKGDKGERGPQGEAGPQGPPGVGEAAFAQNAAVVASIGGGTDVVSGNITLSVPSQLLVSGSAELFGANADERAACNIRVDATQISLSYESTFDDIGANNEATVAVNAGANNVAAGAHTVTMRCSAITGTVGKDDAAINIIGIPVG